MRASAKQVLYVAFAVAALPLFSLAQELERVLPIREGGTVEVVNYYGRVSAKAEPATDDQPMVATLNAPMPAGIPTTAIKSTGKSGHVTITVEPPDKKARIDLVLMLPERTNIKIETLSGAVEVGGNFASIDVKTDTATVAVDVPDDDLKYQFTWTQSKPRYLADFDIAEIKEMSAGRFEVKGRKGEKRKAETRPVGSVPSDPDEREPTATSKSHKDKKKKSTSKQQKSVTLNFTTARGIILLNVPPSEVMSDLRERPLTNAAKAIIRSGDSMLMEAIRRASPKYFGDYAKTLPPIGRQPTLRGRSEQTEITSLIKTALVRVTDVHNRAIPGLEAKDFEVLENGKERDIISVERSTAPFNLVLLLDVSGSVENYVNFIRKAARSFVDTVDKNDRVSIITFNEDVKVLSKFTTDKGKLSESLDTFDAGGGTAYYDALAFTLADTLRSLKGERTAIVILTDGDDNRSFLPFDALLGSIQESGSLIYPLYLPSDLIAAAAASPNGDIDPTRTKYMSLTAKSQGEGERLAKVSGGVYYPITQVRQIQQAYEDIVVQLRTAYNVTFRSDIAAVGASPRLKISVKRDNTFAVINSVVAASPPD
jgi:VWFA-related protein